MTGWFPLFPQIWKMAECLYWMAKLLFYGFIWSTILKHIYTTYILTPLWTTVVAIRFLFFLIWRLLWLSSFFQTLTHCGLKWLLVSWRTKNSGNKSFPSADRVDCIIQEWAIVVIDLLFLELTLYRWNQDFYRSPAVAWRTCTDRYWKYVAYRSSSMNPCTLTEVLLQDCQ